MKPWEYLALNPSHQSQLAAYHNVKREVDNYYYEESTREKPKER